MPVAGMRRSTRVFVPKTKDGSGGGEGVRVLRSGRRLWVDSSDEDGIKGGGRGKESDDDNSWMTVIGQLKSAKGWNQQKKQRVQEMAFDVEDSAPDLVSRERDSSVHGGRSDDRLYGQKYSRKKRKWNCSGGCDGNNGGEGGSDKLYKQHYVRRPKRRNLEKRASVGNLVQDGDILVLYAFVEPSGAWSGRFNRLLRSILRRMCVAELGMEELVAFLTWGSMASVFASHGISFSTNRRLTKSSGCCKVFGAVDFIPLFELNISAAPLGFLYLHSRMLFRSVYMSSVLVFHTANTQGGDEEVAEVDDELQPASTFGVNTEIIILDQENSEFGVGGRNSGKTVALGAAKNGYLEHRNDSIARAAHKRQRRSLRTRRSDPSLLTMTTPNISISPKHVAPEKSTLPGSYTGSNSELKKAGRRNPGTGIKFIRSTSFSFRDDVDAASCSGNLLVVESDRCYRVEEAGIVLETNDSNEWVLAVKKDGSIKYSIKAPTEIKPSSINRYTHAVMWFLDNGWRLEFPDRNEWAIFKELARACAERNSVPASPVVKSIPVPGVLEVSLMPTADGASFSMPFSYIKMDNELSRALLRRNANYDADSDDEQWLSKFNKKHEPSEPITVEIFELMVDAFEKASYISPENFGNLAAAVEVCTDLAGKNVAEAVHTYWVKKRTEKQGPLLRVFKLHQPRPPPEGSTDAVLRKRRLSKRLASPSGGKGKNLNVLEAMAVEQHAQLEHSALLRAERARTLAERAIEVAICKRQRAQFLMENADLATYRAAMMVRIADAAQAAQGGAHFLD
ncbi:hypothetical protein AKJ16_DCAP19513 [Drosera capensis]